MIKIIFYLFLYYLINNYYVNILFNVVLLIFLIKIIKSNKSLIKDLNYNINKNNINLGILIPVYNEENNLEKLINSIFKYNIHNTQIIFINDSSNDNSLNILENYKNIYKFDIININKQKYVCDVLNNGFLYLNNNITHVGIINADCILSENCINKVIYKLKNYEIDVLNLSNKSNNYNNYNIFNYCASIEKEYKNYIFDKIESSLNNGYFIKKEILLNINCWNTITEDLNLSLKIKSLNLKIYFDPYIHIYDSLPVDFKSLKNQKFRWNYGDLINRLIFRETNLFDYIINIYYIFPFFSIINLLLYKNNLIFLSQINIIFIEFLLYYKSKSFHINYFFESIFYSLYQFIFQIYFYIRLIRILIFNKNINW